MVLDLRNRRRSLVLFSAGNFAPVLIGCETGRLLFVANLVEAFARLSELIHILVHIIFVTIIARAAHEVVLLTIVVSLIVWRRVATRLLVLLLAIYLCQRDSINPINMTK